MLKRIFNWQGQRFVYLWLEGEPGQTAERQSQGLFERAGAHLREHGLALDRNVVRTRVYGRTREARDIVSAVRGHAFTGQARAATSSFISPAHFDTAADVALDLYAMAEPSGGRSAQGHRDGPGAALHPSSGVGSARLPCRHDQRTCADAQGAMRGDPAARGCAPEGERLRLEERGAYLLHAAQEPDAPVGARHRRRESRRCRSTMPRSSWSKATRGRASSWRSRSPRSGDADLELGLEQHDQEKWNSIFRPIMRQNERIESMTDST